MNKNFYIVEFRLPYQINTAVSIEDAANKAQAKFEREFNITVSKWFMRLFEYSPDAIGPLSEWFCNPGGVKFMQLTQNHPEHEEIINEQG